MSKAAKLHDAQEQLSQAIAEALDSGRPIPCSNRPQWISDELTTRKTVAPLCSPCPVLLVCREAGRDERAGVWGGIDRTRQHDHPRSLTMPCTTKHRTNKTRAQCEWPWAERIWGSGPWAVVARCNRTTDAAAPTASSTCTGPTTRAGSAAEPHERGQSA